MMTKNEPTTKGDLIPLSVVIATLGGEVLIETIRHLNEGGKYPAEILICIPREMIGRVPEVHATNVKIIATPCRGQVAQRAVGLRAATQPLVMQMDDDIVLLPDARAGLIESITLLGAGHAVGPLYCHLEDGANATDFRTGFVGWVDSAVATFVCGAPWGKNRMGRLSPAGVGYGVDKKYCNTPLFEVDWLPGGCVLCHRQDLVIDDYYPFAGKALTEDLVHSVLWKNKGVRLWAVPGAECATTVVSMPNNWAFFSENFRAHRYVVRLMGKVPLHFFLWSGLSAIKRFFQAAAGR